VKTVLVTGGTGFIGSNLTKALLREGCHVRVLRRENSDLRMLTSLDVEHLIGDVRDRESLRSGMRGCDTVFHTAAVVSHWRKERPLMIDVNVRGTRNIVESCLELGIRRLVHTSSTAAVGFPEDGSFADETIRFNWEPYDVGYRQSKHDAEREIQRGVQHGLDAVMVNPTVVIGPGDVHFHGGQLIRDIFKKKIFYYVQGGMSITYVDDVVRCHIQAARQGRSGERYILSGQNLSHREIISTIADVVGGIKPKFRMPTSAVHAVTFLAESAATLLNRKPWVTRELLAGSNLNYYFSCTKAQIELGYSFIPFREAVQLTFDWYKKHGLL
jgi:dihydroflavonol-4-reductase